MVKSYLDLFLGDRWSHFCRLLVMPCNWYMVKNYRFSDRTFFLTVEELGQIKLGTPYYTWIFVTLVMAKCPILAQI